MNGLPVSLYSKYEWSRGIAMNTKKEAVSKLIKKKPNERIKVHQRRFRENNHHPTKKAQ
jgi:hypothetical protein